MGNLLGKWNKISLVVRIFIGLAVGLVLAIAIPEQAQFLSIFGSLFVSALKAVAPILFSF